MRGRKDAGAAQLLKSFQPFGHHGFAESAPPMFGGNTHQYSDGTAGVIIVTDRAKGGELARAR